MKDINGNELDALDLHEWLDYGIAQGWIAEPNCYNHESLPMTAEEEDDMELGGDPCMQVIRLWDV